MIFDLIIDKACNNNLIAIKDLLIPLVSAGFGAFAGGYFAQKNYLKNSFKCDIQYINYTNSILFGLLNSLYSLKNNLLLIVKLK